jgi:hypothetical protein
MSLLLATDRVPDSALAVVPLRRPTLKLPSNRSDARGTFCPHKHLGAESWYH